MKMIGSPVALTQIGLTFGAIYITWEQVAGKLEDPFKE